MANLRNNKRNNKSKRIKISSINKQIPLGDILSQGLFDINKLHKQEIENRRDKKLNSKITSLFYSTLICIIFALIIFLNIRSYDLTSGFRLFMIVIMIIFIILIPILAAKMFILYFKLKKHRKR